jgi:hypothetical protein
MLFVTPPSDDDAHQLLPTRTSEGSASSAQVPKSCETSVTAQPIEFASCSNLLGRLLHEAIVGTGSFSPQQPLRGDLPQVIRLLVTARAAEIVAAEEAMFKELGYGINNFLASIVPEEKARLQEILSKKGLTTISAPALDIRLQEQFLVREFERANIFTRRQIPTTIKQKLALLDGYLSSVLLGLEGYPQTFERVRRAAEQSDGQFRCWIAESITRGVWSDFGAEPSPEEVIERAATCAADAKRIVNQFQRNPETMSSENIRSLVRNLDVTNRITFEYARDYVEAAKLTFAETQPTGFLERLFNVKPRAACNAAFSALFERVFLIKRATGVGEFVDHMRESLRAANR